MSEYTLKVRVDFYNKSVTVWCEPDTEDAPYTGEGVGHSLQEALADLSRNLDDIFGEQEAEV